MTQYFYALGTERKGPVTLAELRAAPITRTTLVWYEGLADWKPATEFPELSDLFMVQGDREGAQIFEASAPAYAPPPAPSGPPPPPQMGAGQGPPMQRPGPRRLAHDELGGPPPKTWLIESILVTVLCCLPLGIVGIVNASKVESRYYAGDIEQANHYSREAGKWTKIGLYVGIAFLVLYIGSIFLGIFANAF